MALSKRVALPSGITTNYHRIVSINTVTNEQNTIEVASYTSRQKRADEAAWLESQRVHDAEYRPLDVFIATTYINVPYDQSMTVDGAYVYLKTLPEFEGANDLLDEDTGCSDA